MECSSRVLPAVALSVVTRRELGDGALRMASLDVLPAYPERMTERLLHWARVVPRRTFLAERDSNDAWREISCAETLRSVRVLGQALLDRGLSPERPLAILSGNDINHALLALAAQYVGVPCVPVSPQYALLSKDYSKLRHVLAITTPGLIYVADATVFRPAVEAVAQGSVEVVAANEMPGRGYTPFADLLAAQLGLAVDAAHDRVGLDTIAKILFTSGFTGSPKGMIVTPGYWRQPDYARRVFDDEGYYRTGDAATLVDPERPEQGLEFDGRMSSESWRGKGRPWPSRARWVGRAATVRGAS